MIEPFLSDFGGGGEPIKRDDGEKDTRRKVFSVVLGNLKLTVFDKGPFVNIEPTGVKISDKTHFPVGRNGQKGGMMNKLRLLLMVDEFKEEEKKMQIIIVRIYF
jgi:hypothetical protein